MSEPSPIPVPPDAEAWVQVLRRGLDSDPDLADAFARTPGKVAHRLGIPYAEVPEVLARYASGSHR